jgi:hypothetical protein
MFVNLQTDAIGHVITDAGGAQANAQGPGTVVSDDSASSITTATGQ